MALTELETLYSAASAAIAAGDWAVAIGRLMAVKLRLATMPTLARTVTGSMSETVAWTGPNLAELDTLIGECKRRAAAARQSTSGPFSQCPIVYARAGASEE